jgi:hypothetical protein
MSSFISCYNLDIHIREHFEVPHNVYVYVHLLENVIKGSKDPEYIPPDFMVALYPELFKEKQDE